MEKGCYTALITPFSPDNKLDQQGLGQLIEFQIENGITGILATGTTGESPTLKWEEHDHVVDLTVQKIQGRCQCVAGAGSNNTQEAMAASRHAKKCGVNTVLLVDPYYNGPSSFEIRTQYYQAIAKELPDVEVIPYIIPGRTGAQMLPQDLAILASQCPNIRAVKEATGNLENMKQTRSVCGKDFQIFSGDDALVYTMMTDSDIMACGAISVMSNIVPRAMAQMVEFLNQKETDAAMTIQKKIAPLLDLVGVSTEEVSPFGPVVCKARNPLPLKTMMQILGMPSGACRPPLGKLTPKALELVIGALEQVYTNNPEVFEPIESFFNVHVGERLSNPDYRQGLSMEYEKTLN